MQLMAGVGTGTCATTALPSSNVTPNCIMCVRMCFYSQPTLEAQSSCMHSPSSHTPAHPARGATAVRVLGASTSRSLHL